MTYFSQAFRLVRQHLLIARLLIEQGEIEEAMALIESIILRMPVDNDNISCH